MRYRNLWLKLYADLIDPDVQAIQKAELRMLPYRILCWINHTFLITKECVVCLLHMTNNIFWVIWYVATFRWLLADAEYKKGG